MQNRLRIKFILFYSLQIFNQFLIPGLDMSTAQPTSKHADTFLFHADTFLFLRLPFSWLCRYFLNTDLKMQLYYFSSQEMLDVCLQKIATITYNLTYMWICVSLPWRNDPNLSRNGAILTQISEIEVAYRTSRPPFWEMGIWRLPPHIRHRVYPLPIKTYTTLVPTFAKKVIFQRQARIREIKEKGQLFRHKWAKFLKKG